MLELFAQMTVQMKIITKQVPKGTDSPTGGSAGAGSDAGSTLTDWDILEAGGQLVLELDFSKDEEDSG